MGAEPITKSHQAPAGPPPPSEAPEAQPTAGMLNPYELLGADREKLTNLLSSK